MVTNYLVRRGEKKTKGHVPGFDEYELGFNTCDVFNRSLNDKSWPHRYSGRGVSSEIQSGSDFLFTAAFVNLWNLWRTLDFESRKDTKFEDFCVLLAKDIVMTQFEP